MASGAGDRVRGSFWELHAGEQGAVPETLMGAGPSQVVSGQSDHQSENGLRLNPERVSGRLSVAVSPMCPCPTKPPTTNLYGNTCNGHRKRRIGPPSARMLLQPRPFGQSRSSGANWPSVCRRNFDEITPTIEIPAPAPRKSLAYRTRCVRSDRVAVPSRRRLKRRLRREYAQCEAMTLSSAAARSSIR